MKLVTASMIMLFAAAPALAGGHASGDAAAGEKAFRQCQACHSITDGEGNNIVKGGKTGPNLYGLPGRTAGTDEGFNKYKASLVAAGDAGLVWDEEHFVSWVQDPNGFLKEYLDDGTARAGMAFRVRKEEDAVNIWAYIASVSPEPEMEDGGT